MALKNIPSKKEFKKEFGVGSLRRSLPKGSMHRISKLLELHDSMMMARRNPARLELLHDIEMHASYALRHRESSGIADNQKRIDSVKSLKHSARGEICQIVKVRHFSEAKAKLENQFGFKATNHDPHDVGVYDMQPNELQACALQFVNGSICMMDPDAPDSSILYDTDYEAQLGAGQSNLEHGGALFVLNRNLKLCVSGRNYASLNGSLKHTSFMKGEGVLAAGTLRCEMGQLKWISAKSGHYQPTARHMLTLVEFLRAKHIDLRKVDFHRIVLNPRSFVDQPELLNKIGKGEFDSCNAMEFLNTRGFPGPNPQDMFI